MDVTPSRHQEWWDSIGDPPLMDANEHSTSSVTSQIPTPNHPYPPTSTHVDPHSEGKLKIKPGAPSKYPWDLWFDGDTHILVRGKDFDAIPERFRNMIGNNARRRELIVLTRITYKKDIAVKVCKDRTEYGLFKSYPYWPDSDPTSD